MLQKSSVICIYFLARSSCKRFFSSCSSREQSINGRLFQSFPWVGGAVAAPVVFWWIWRSTAIIVIDPFGWLATFPRHYKYGKCLPCPFFQAITVSVIFDKYCQWQSFRTRSFYAFVMSWNNDIYDDNFFSPLSKHSNRLHCAQAPANFAEPKTVSIATKPFLLIILSYFFLIFCVRKIAICQFVYSACALLCNLVKGLNRKEEKIDHSFVYCQYYW